MRLFSVGIVLSIVLAPMIVHAQEGKQISVSASSTIWSAYVDDSIVISGNAVIQTDITVGLPHGFYAGVWHSAGLNDADLSSDYADELDVYAGWAGTVGGDIHLDLGVNYVDLMELGDLSEQNVIKPYGVLSKSWKFDRQTLTPYVGFEYLQPLNWDLSSGTQVSAGIRHRVQLSENVAFRHSAEILYDDGALGFGNGFIGEYHAGLEYSVAEGITLTPIKIKLEGPLESMDDNREAEIVYGTGVSFQF